MLCHSSFQGEHCFQHAFGQHIEIEEGRLDLAAGKPSLLFLGSRGGPSQMATLSNLAKGRVKIGQTVQSPVQNGLGVIHDAVCFEERGGTREKLSQAKLAVFPVA